MDVDEIRKLHDELGKVLTDAVQVFEKTTNTRVRALWPVRDGSEIVNKICIEVPIEVMS